MTDADRRPIAARSWRASAWLADALIRARASPDAISVIGMVFAAFAGFCLAFAAAWPLWLAAALLILLRLLCNMLDGMVAVGRGIASPRGELFNEIPDRVSDTAVLLGLGIAANDAALGLAAALAAIATAYVRAVGKGAGAGSDFSGPMAKQQRMLLSVLAALLCIPLGPDPRIPAVVLWIICVGSVFTALRRLWRIGGKLG